MSSVSYPLAFGHWQLRGRKLICRLPRHTVTVEAPAALLQQVLALCDGQRAWNDVTDELGKRWAMDAVNGFLQHLHRSGVLIESAHALAAWSELGQLPDCFPVLATPDELPQLAAKAQSHLLPGRGVMSSASSDASRNLIDLLSHRESHHTFADKALTYREICTVVWAAHGVARPGAEPAFGHHRTMGASGNIHNVRWFVMLLRPAEVDGSVPMTEGFYEARFHTEGGASLHQLSSHKEDAWRVLQDPRVLQFASAMIIPVAGIHLPARKYGNRAVTFAQIEVGQALQNAQLMACAMGIAATVRGDSLGEAVLDLAGVALGDEAPSANSWLALPALVLGCRPSPDEVRQQRPESWLRIFPAPVPKRAQQAHCETSTQFAYRACDRAEELSASGRSSNPRTALVKAEAEAWERLGWRTLKGAREGTIDDVAGAIDPSSIAAYTAQQYATPGFPLAPFDPQQPYVWMPAMDADSGAVAHVPAEHAVSPTALPGFKQDALLTYSSTSGIAAWTDPQQALQLAVLELIERDAFLRQWLARRSPPSMVESSLPRAIRARVHALSEMGARVTVTRLDDAPVPVFTVFVQDVARPFTGITAAAAFDEEAALSKAMDEAEGRLLHAHEFPAQPLRSGSHINGIPDICRYYQTRRYFRQADFYAAGSVTQIFGKGEFCANWPALSERFSREKRRILAVNLTPDGASIHQGRTKLHVMRAIVPGLIPIWFIAGLEPAGLSAFHAIQASASTRRHRAPPIHPFT